MYVMYVMYATHVMHVMYVMFVLYAMYVMYVMFVLYAMYVMFVMYVLYEMCNAMQCNATQCMYVCMYVCMLAEVYFRRCRGRWDWNRVRVPFQLFFASSPGCSLWSSCKLLRLTSLWSTSSCKQDGAKPVPHNLQDI